jgi:membrane protein DedA with SNARE-associated domain
MPGEPGSAPPVIGAPLLVDFGVSMPGETLLISASILASQGELRLVPLASIAWLPAVLGDNIGYAIELAAGE